MNNDRLKAVHPTFDNVVVKKVNDVESDIIHIPEHATRTSQRFEVLAVGPDVADAAIQAGQFVFVAMASAWNLMLPGSRKEWFMCRAGDILGICELYTDKEMAKIAKEASRAA